MERVGQHLQNHAGTLTAVQDERDLFGRSAYNRYYYASFLRARQMMICLDEDKWSKLAHAAYPETLRKSIKKALQIGMQKARRIDDQETARLLSQASKAAVDLALLMEGASRIRVVADYNPDIPVEFSAADRFSLNNVDIAVARQWPPKVEAWASLIERAWSQLDD